MGIPWEWKFPFTFNVYQTVTEHGWEFYFSPIKYAIPIPTRTIPIPIPIPISSPKLLPFPWESHGNGNSHSHAHLYFDRSLKMEGHVAHQPLLGDRKLEGLPFHVV